MASIDPRSIFEGVAAVVVAVTGLWLRWRVKRGTVQTSDAEGLWQEAALIRQDLRKAEADARREAADYAEKNVALHGEIHDLRNELTVVKGNQALLSDEHTRCLDNVEALQIRVQVLERGS